MKPWSIPESAAIFLAAALAGCGHAPPPPAAGGLPAPAWNWLDFRRADRVLLVPLQGTLAPSKLEILKAPRDGWLNLAPGLGAAQEDRVEAGALIGRMAPGSEDFDIEAEKLHAELARVDAELRTVRAEQAAEALQDQERKAKQDIAEYEAALTLAHDPALQRDLLPQAAQTTQADIQALKQHLADARTRLEKVQQAEEKHALLQQRQTELTDQKADFERRQKLERDEIRAPFAGQLRWITPVAEIPKPAGGMPAPRQAPPVRRAWARQDAVLAVIRDDASMSVRAEIGDASLLSGDVGRLRFSFLVEGQPAEAVFNGRAPEDFAGPAGGGRAPAYLFRVADGSPSMVRLSGSQVAGKLFQVMPETAYIIPKMRLLAHRPDAFADGNWKQNGARVFPGARVLAVGRDEVAMVPPDDLSGTGQAPLPEAK